MKQDLTPQEEGALLAALFGDRSRAQFVRENDFPGGASMVSQHLSGHRPISIVAAAVYARGLGVPISAFSPRLARQIQEVSLSMRPNGGSAPGPEQSNVAEAPALMASRLIPVVGHVKGGVDGYLEEMNFPVGHGEGRVEYWTKDPEAYALRVRGDSMSPRYRAREFIVVTPSVEAQPGNDVMVKLRDGRKLLKHLNWIRGEEIQLISVNDGYEPMTLLREEIESIQRVAGGVPADAFLEDRSH